MAGERVEALLYEGETVADSVAWDGARVVLTSHRLLVFTPGGEGANFRAVDRPNVEGLETGARSRTGLLERGLRYGLLGAVLVGAGAVVDLGGIVDGVDLSGTDQLGLGGLGATMQRLLGLLARLDQLLQAAGALGVLLGVALLAAWWYTREPTLRVAVAGGEDVRVPRPDDPDRRRLAELLAGAGPGDTPGPSEGGQRPRPGRTPAEREADARGDER